MDNYTCLDVSKKARSICKTFCTGRVQYNGRGLVHQLPWPVGDPDLIPSDTTLQGSRSGSVGSYEETVSRSARRSLLSISLPATVDEGGSIDASDDGHCITFRSPSIPLAMPKQLSREKRRCIKRKVDQTVDRIELADSESHRDGDSTNDAEEGCTMQAHDGVIVTIDLSKLEQRIMTKEGALGIALAVSFVNTIFSVGDDKISGTSSDDELFVLLTRFDNLRVPWERARKQFTAASKLQMLNDTPMNDSDRGCNIGSDDDLNSTRRAEKSSNTINTIAGKDLGETMPDKRLRDRYIEEDARILNTIHFILMERQDFIWPRMYEAAAAINRLRCTKFN